MKLAPLLAQYLHSQKKLELTGVGTFILDPSARTYTDPKHASEGISFDCNLSLKEDEALISFISAQTGKQKALASSDLGSYLELAKQFLNIGKPFQIEGIGTLVKKKSGQYEFTPEHQIGEKIKETGIKELSSTSTSDESFTTYENLKPRIEKSTAAKKILVVFLAIGTAAIIIWAGYKMYKKNSAGTTAEEDTETTIPVNIPDSSKLVTNAGDNTKPGTYKFVIEVANRKRALYRYDMLKKSNLPIQITTADSVTYKLYFVLPATPADTARMSDSLSLIYPAINRKRAFAEK